MGCKKPYLCHLMDATLLQMKRRLPKSPSLGTKQMVVKFESINKSKKEGRKDGRKR